MLEVARTWGQARSPSAARAWFDALDPEDQAEVLAERLARGPR